MVPFVMVVRDEFTDGAPKGPFTDENHAVQAGFLDGPNEPLRERIEIRRMGRQADHLYSGATSLSRNASVNNGTRLWIKKRFPQKAIVDIGEVALIWLIQAPSGSDAMPAMWMRRVDKSMMKEHREPRQPATGPDVQP